MRHWPRDAGLTLIEMLVVLAIIGIASGATLLSLRGGRSAVTAQSEANRLATVLQAAADAALAGGTRAFVADAHGYAVVDWDAAHARWTAGVRHPLADGLDLDGTPPAPTPFARAADGEPLTLTLRGATAPWQVTFDGLTATAAPVAGTAT